MSALTTTRTDDGNTTTWAVHTDTRATSLTVARGTPDQVTRMIEAAPSAAGFCDVDTAAVLLNVSAHHRGAGDAGAWLEECPILGGPAACDAYTPTLTRPLFHAAARTGFDDAAVWALLAELHAKAVAR